MLFSGTEPVLRTWPEKVIFLLKSVKFGIWGETALIPTATGRAADRAASAAAEASARALPGNKLAAPTNSAKAESARQTRLVT